MRTRWPGFAAFHSGHVAVVEFISAVWARLRSFAQCVGRPSRGSRSVSLPQDRHDAVASGPSPSSTLVGARIELIIRVMRLEVGLDAGKVYGSRGQLASNSRARWGALIWSGARTERAARRAS
jgi:hypothetical protein